MIQDEANDNVDLDALQAQIDLSMALTDELVSSWLTKSTPTTSKSKSFDHELQEYLRRPPRLGVGAPLPEASSVNSRQSDRLKVKLSGNGNKRRRDEVEVPAKMDESSDEEMGKGRKMTGDSGTKRARLDPFDVGKNVKGTVSKSRKKPGIVEATPGLEGNKGVLAPIDAIPVADHQVVAEDNKTLNKQSNGPSVSSQTRAKSPELHEATDVTSALKKKKKKKKRNANLGSDSRHDNNESKESSGSKVRSDDSLPGRDVLHVGDDGRSANGNIKTSTTAHKLLDEEAVPLILAATELGTQSLKTPKHPFIKEQEGVPLLNLHGPPPEASDDTITPESSPKKKRKRRRKKGKVCNDSGL